MWRILSRNALGLIMLFDNSRADPLADLALCLTHFAEELQQIPCVIGVGRLESHPQPSLDAYAESLAAHGLLLPILAVDVRKREDVLCMLDTLLIQIETMDLPEHDH
jgi:signal recognition particle receptor subunit beta